jgi:hypothetical protein
MNRFKFLGFVVLAFVAVMALAHPQSVLAQERKLVAVNKQIVMRAGKIYLYFNPALFKQVGQQQTISLWEGSRVTGWIRALRLSATQVEVSTCENGTIWGYPQRYPISTTDREGQIYYAFPEAEVNPPMEFVVDFTKCYSLETWHLPQAWNYAPWGERQELVAMGDTRTINGRVRVFVERDYEKQDSADTISVTVIVDGFPTEKPLRPGEMLPFWGASGEYLGRVYLLGVSFEQNDPYVALLSIIA